MQHAGAGKGLGAGAWGVKGWGSLTRPARKQACHPMANRNAAWNGKQQRPGENSACGNQASKMCCRYGEKSGDFPCVLGTHTYFGTEWTFSATFSWFWPTPPLGVWECLGLVFTPPFFSRSSKNFGAAKNEPPPPLQPHPKVCLTPWGMTDWFFSE